MRVHALSFMKKVSIRWWHLSGSGSMTRGALRCRRCKMQVAALRAFMSAMISVVDEGPIAVATSVLTFVGVNSFKRKKRVDYDCS